MKIEPPKEAEPEFAMAPMIDMVFLLLVFFMCASHMSQSQNIELKIPTASKAVVPKERPDRFVINIEENGTVHKGMQAVKSIDDLAADVKAERERNPDIKVYLRADANTEHRQVKKVMNAMAEAGVDDFIFGVYIPPSSANGDSVP